LRCKFYKVAIMRSGHIYEILKSQLRDNSQNIEIVQNNKVAVEI